MDEMESLRIEQELDRQKSGSGRNGNRTTNSENRDSGVADVEVCPCPFQQVNNGGTITEVQPEAQLKRSALSNSLLDMHEQCKLIFLLIFILIYLWFFLFIIVGVEKPQRRGSVGSLDSGMSISFQSTSASTNSSRNDSKRILQHPGGPHQQPGLFGGIFNKRERKPSRSDESGAFGKSTEV